MHKLRPLLTIVLLLSAACGLAQPVTKVAFGSCSHEDDPDQLWTEIVATGPDLWIWLGDNIYGDSPDLDVLKAKYEMQKSSSGYQSLLKTTKVIGTWDDHDYGINDGGKYFQQKEGSKKLALDFLGVPEKANVRKRDGIYDSYTVGTDDRIVKVILLDTRYFRDTLHRSSVKGRRYEANPDGDILGDAQWEWLEKELKSSDAAIHIIASSIQFVANEHGFEKWGNFPRSRQRMLDLLAKIKPNNTFFISGDRHIGEVSKMSVDSLPYSLYDFTSSGLTHTWDEIREEPNEYRVGQLIVQKNFGLITINWNQNLPDLVFELRGKDGVVWQSTPVRF